MEEALEEGARGVGVGFEEEAVEEEAFFGLEGAGAGLVDDEGAAVCGEGTLGEAGASGWRNKEGETPVLPAECEDGR